MFYLGKLQKKWKRFWHLEKGYKVKAEFGYATDSQDETGKKVIQDNKGLVVSRNTLEEITHKKFLGEIQQIPSSYSAIKINGRKAYEYARVGKEVQISPRTIKISEFSCIEYSWPFVTFNIFVHQERI